MFNVFRSKKCLILKIGQLIEDYLMRMFVEKYTENVFILLLNPFCFHENYEKQKGPRNSYQSLFRLPNMLRNFLSLVIHLAISNALIQIGFWVIPKVTVDNLCKFHDIVIIPLLTSSPNVKMLEGRKLQKFEYLKNQKSVLDEMKSFYHNFFRTFCWWNKKKQQAQPLS